MSRGRAQTTRMRLTETSWNFFSHARYVASRRAAIVPRRRGYSRAATRVAVIGYGLWQRLFGGDRRAIGTTIRVNGAPLEDRRRRAARGSTIRGRRMSGLRPRSISGAFRKPDRRILLEHHRAPQAGAVVGPGPPGLRGRGLRDDSARRRQPDAANRPALTPLQEQLAGPVRNASLILMGGVALLLLLACANVANLLLARTIGRSNELRIRSALGASRARLTQQLLTETLLLSLVASVAGLLVARWTAAVAAAVQPAELSSQSYTILDLRVLGFAIAASILTGVVFGVGPALFAARGDSDARANSHRGASAYADAQPAHRLAGGDHDRAPDGIRRARPRLPRPAPSGPRVRPALDRDDERLGGRYGLRGGRPRRRPTTRKCWTDPRGPGRAVGERDGSSAP